MDDLGTMLGVWAHPDDETYLAAGLMARAVRGGSRVVCITATRGEGGSMDEEVWPPEAMGEVRSAEMERSMQILGVTEHHWLDLPDIDMDTPLPEEGYEKVRALVAEVRPDTLLTFGPDGMTGHRAHMSVSAWATRRSTKRQAAPGFCTRPRPPTGSRSSSRSGSLSTSSGRGRRQSRRTISSPSTSRCRRTSCR
jgi:LmbE family N-acetylglucosaminyl deacetylase